MNLYCEKCYPAVIGAFVFIASFAMSPQQKTAIAVELTGPALNILAITVGFLAAALTILLTAPETEAIKKLKSVPHFKLLVGYHWKAISWGFGAALFSLFILIIYKFASSSFKILPEVLRCFCFSAWLGTVVYAFAAFYRVIRLLNKLLLS